MYYIVMGAGAIIFFYGWDMLFKKLNLKPVKNKNKDIKIAC